MWCGLEKTAMVTGDVVIVRKKWELEESGSWECSTMGLAALWSDRQEMRLVIQQHSPTPWDLVAVTNVKGSLHYI
jgi:hypothetical protein